MSDGSQGTVALGASMSIGSYRLPRVLGRFRTEHPRADLRLSIFDSEHAIEGTRDGTLDFCVVVLDAEDEVPGMELEVLGYDELVVVGTPEATPDSGQVTVDEFARLPFIEVPDGIVRRSFVDRHLRRIGVKERNIVLQLGHPEAMKRATREGLGVALMFRSAVQDELDQGVLREVQVQGADLWVPIFLVSRKGKTFSPLHRGLIAAIREELDSSAIQQPAKAVITA
jgi:DNA-binding transcriptional LysR family regulator